MAQTISESLHALKPNLPRGYQPKLAQTLAGIELHQVKDAFAGRLKDFDICLRIFNAAEGMAAEYLDKLKEVEQRQRLIAKKARTLKG